VSVHIDSAEVRTKPIPACRNGNIVHRDARASMLVGGTAGQIDLDGLEYLAPAEGRPRRAATQQDLVHVVMEDCAEVIEVVAAQSHADMFGDAIADGVRMPSPLRSTTSMG
jgi:hypothetical protein